MPFIEKIVDYINTSLKESSLNDKRFQPGKFAGIATVIARKNGERLELMPGLCDINGEYKTVEPNDKYSIIVYHKVISNVYSKAKTGYGESFAYSAISEMQLVVIADSRKVKLTAEQIEPMIIYGLPQRLSPAFITETGIRSSMIIPVSSNMDKIMVFRQEYPSAEYFLKPYHQLFSIRYRVDIGFDKNCIDKCLCSD